jgi:hypothetical protein
MLYPSQSSEIKSVYQLLDGYSFDVNDYSADAVIAGWLEQYGSVWVNHAITEALYQGRYKLISIDQILKLWQRRGHPIRHFNREFESIILGQTLLFPGGYGDGASEGQVAAESDPVTPAATPVPPSLASSVDPAAIAPAAPERSHAKPVTDAAIASPGSYSEKIPDFRPLSPDLEPVSHHTDEIQPFVPRQDGSELHQRLQAVVKGGMRD